MTKFFYVVLAIVIMASCKEKYDPPIKSPVTGYLVVEGVVSSGNDTTTLITLTRSTGLDNRNIVFETGATVRVEGQDNSTHILIESSTGHYTANGLNLNPTQQYRLHINTGAGKEYLSDFVSVVPNPPIDSIARQRINGGLQLYVSTHNPNNTTRYYQWTYAETWEFHSPYQSFLKYKIVNSGSNEIWSVVYKDSLGFSFDPKILTCWKYRNSTQILLGSTAKLASDIIYLPLNYIQPEAQELSVLYSIDLKQYGWSKEGYEFLEKMKKNTEQTGSIFDAQPSELAGNIHAVGDPTEIVVGFFNVCPVAEHRLFIRNTEIVDWGYFRADCSQTQIPNVSDSIKILAAGSLPTSVAKTSPFGQILSFYVSEPTCVDCTLTGSNRKPSYWP